MRMQGKKRISCMINYELFIDILCVFYYAEKYEGYF